MVHAAAPCPPEVKRRMIEWWGDSIMEYYAATEGGGTIVTAEEWLEKPGTVGKAWPGAEIRIFDDDGNQLAGRRDRHRLHGAGPGRTSSTRATRRRPRPTASRRRRAFFTVGDSG